MAICYAKEIQATFAHKQYPDTPQHDAQSYTVCNVHGSNDWIYRAFLKYDISPIPYKSIISSAKLYVYCCYQHDNAATATHNLTRVTEDWDETTLTWNNIPEQNTEMYLENWATTPAVNTWGSYNITRMVQEWVDGTYPNYGLQFINNNEGAYRTEWRFYNRRYGSGQYATYIEIEYEPAEEYRITRTRLTELSDEVQTLSGIDTAMKPSEMVEHLTAANANVSSEASLIAQIMTALGGKTAGESGLPENAKVYYVGVAENTLTVDAPDIEVTAAGIKMEETEA